MDITITIPNAKVNELKTGFLKVNPVPLDEETGQPLHTELQWFKIWMIKKVLESYREGKKKIAVEQSQVIIEDVLIS